MNRHLAATLICLCCHAGATFASDGGAQAATNAATPPPAATAPPATLARPSAGLISSANAAETTPMVRRAATHTDSPPRYVQALAAMRDASPAAAREADTNRQGDHSNTLWIVGLVLIAGIALRRWGFERA